jgi:hypothetical protein
MQMFFLTIELLGAQAACRVAKAAEREQELKILRPRSLQVRSIFLRTCEVSFVMEGRTATIFFVKGRVASDVWTDLNLVMAGRTADGSTEYFKHAKVD